jgi:translation initiation factor 2B subunit (eIF-2B alpha/beta/delta family)
MSLRAMTAGKIAQLRARLQALRPQAYNAAVAQSAKLLREIAEDHRSGATALTRRTAEALLAFLNERPNAEPSALEAFARGLAEAQPAMASIRNLARRAVHAFQQGSLTAAQGAIRKFLQELERSTSRIAEHAAGLVTQRAKVLTISLSSTVLETLKLAQAQGKRIQVICPESRPLREGLQLAQKLAQTSVKVTLCVDALAPSLIADCDLVLVGGDALAPEGLVNKCGTYPLALAARRQNVPFVAAISQLKFLERFEPEWIREMPPDEVLDEPAEAVRVLNRYFDLTPLDLLTRVVTEEGTFSPGGIRRWLQ